MIVCSNLTKKLVSDRSQESHNCVSLQPQVIQDFSLYFQIHEYDYSDKYMTSLIYVWIASSSVIITLCISYSPDVKKVSLSVQKLVSAGDRTWLAAGPHSWKGIHIQYAQEDHRLITSSTAHIPPHTSHHTSLQQHLIRKQCETKASQKMDGQVEVQTSLQV